MSRHTPRVYDPRATTRAHHAAILLALDSIRDFAATANRGDREKIEIALESIEARSHCLAANRVASLLALASDSEGGEA